MQKSTVPGTGPVTASLAIPDMTSTIGALDPTITWSTSGLNVTVITPYNVVHTYSAAAGTIEAITVSGTLAAPANPSTGKFAISHVASGNYFVAGRYDDCGGTASGFIQILVATPNVIMPWIKIQNAAAPAVTIQGNELLNSGSTASGSGTLNQILAQAQPGKDAEKYEKGGEQLHKTICTEGQQHRTARVPGRQQRKQTLDQHPRKGNGLQQH